MDTERGAGIPCFGEEARQGNTPEPDSGAATARNYHSPFRQSQADATRQRILDAAVRLLAERGYVKTTISGIARAARVSEPTVYAVFRSKCGILAEILDHTLQNPDFAALHEAFESMADPHEKLRLGVRLIRMVRENELPPDFAHLGGAGVIDPDLLRLILDRERQRRECLAPFIDELHQAGHLRPDLLPGQALDTLWVLTSRPTYHLVRAEHGWSGQEYEDWLFATLRACLLA